MNDRTFNHVLSNRALDMVFKERHKQHQKWGKQDLTWPEWISVLTEEVGEAAGDANRAQWNDGPLGDLVIEVVHTAAVAVQMLEALIEYSEGGAS